MDFPSGSELFAKPDDCSICPRNCHVNRFSNRLGYCNSNAGLNISSVCIHHGEEPPISGKDGICNIFFKGCNLQCIYCQNYQISSKKFVPHINEQKPADFLDKIFSILDQGINRVGFVSPSHCILQMICIIEKIHSRGYKPVIVFNTNAYDKVETLVALEGLIDIYLPDFKYMEKDLAGTCSDALDYPEIASAAIKEMYRQKGAALHVDEMGNAESGIIIRHLVLPGHTENSVKVLQHIANEISPKLHISLMSQYYPTPLVKCNPVLNRILTDAEYSTVVMEMERLGMENGWKQEMESTSHYQPDFERSDPFVSK